jgi:hypothetical protein
MLSRWAAFAALTAVFAAAGCVRQPPQVPARTATLSSKDPLAAAGEGGAAQLAAGPNQPGVWYEFSVEGTLSNFVIFEPPDPLVEVWTARADTIVADNPTDYWSSMVIGYEDWRDWQVELTVRVENETELAFGARNQWVGERRQFAVYRLALPAAEWRRLLFEALGDQVRVFDLDRGSALLSVPAACPKGGFALFALPHQKLEARQVRARTLPSGSIR